MPTLPLYDRRTDRADTSHQVASPGGYEIWMFEAEDPNRQLYVVASLSNGYPFHPEYRRRYAEYRRRPTRHAPPLPSEYPCAALAIYEAGVCRAKFVAQVRPEAFRASSDNPQVRVGPSHFERGEHGELQMHMRGIVGDGKTLTANMVFTPVFGHPAAQLGVHPREVSGADHFWVINHPLCRVDGEILLFSDGNPTARVIKLEGLGSHDHRYGSGPLGEGASRVIRGRVLMEDRAITFVHATPVDISRPEETVFVAADGSGVHQLRVAGLLNRKRRTTTALPYPSVMRFGDLLTLHRPRVIDSTWATARVLYDAGDSDVKALCEIVSPPRWRAPLLSRMMESEIGHA